MATEQPTVEQLAKREQEIRGSEAAPIYYANYLGVLGTKGDIRLRFGQVEEATAEKLSVNVSAHIYIAPDHLVDFVQLLLKKMREYGELFPNTAWERIAAQVIPDLSETSDQAPSE